MSASPTPTRSPRRKTLAVEAAARLAAFGLENVSVAHADALAAEEALGRFDRVIAHALIEPPAPRLTRWLDLGGVMVAAIADEDIQRIVRLTVSAEGGLQAEALGAVRTLTPLVVGLMRAL
jgi:protein-L-isoaspartate O-methyltransferase